MNAPNRPLGRRVVHPMPAPNERPRRVYYPSDYRQVPTHCAHCGTRLLVSDRPTAEMPLVDLECYLCSRVACELVYDGLRSKPLVFTKCACGAEAAYDEPRECRACHNKRLAREAQRARRQKARERPPCRECREVPARVDGRLCGACSMRRFHERQKAGVTP